MIKDKILKIKELFPETELNESKIIGIYKTEQQNNLSVTIKILSVFGGLFATLAFIAFIAISGIWDSATALEIIGFTIIGFALFLHKKVKNLLLDTFSISAYLVGVVLVVFGLNSMHISENTIIFIVFLIGVISLIINQSYILSFIAFLLLEGSVLFYFQENQIKEMLSVFIIVNLILTTFIFFNEAFFYSLKNKLTDLYAPVRVAFVVVLLFSMSIISIKNNVILPVLYQTFLSLVVAFTFLYVVYKIAVKMQIKDRKSVFILVIIALSISGIAFFAPQIIVALTLILLSYYVHSKMLFVLSILSFLLFIGFYYYNLDETLLYKSIVLMALGLLFLSFNIFILKKANA